MGQIHSVDLKLKAKFNEKNLKHLLQRGTELGFVFFDLRNFTDADYGQLAKKIFTETRDESEGELFDADNLPYVELRTKLEDTGFDIIFRPRGDRLIEIRIRNFNDPWIKKFWGEEQGVYCIDFSRYTRFALKMVSDFVIDSLLADSL